MEAAGLAVGVVGLAGLFSTCIECYRLVEKGAYLGEDWRILETKFKNQRLRFRTWGQACGLDRIDHPVAEDLWGQEVAVQVELTLKSVAELFKRHEKLLKRYSCSEEPRGLGSKLATATLGKLAFQSASLLGISDAVDLAKSSLVTRHSTRRAFLWAISDKQKLADLVQHLKDFNDDLDAMTAESARQRQRDLIREEVESIVDIQELEIMETAHMGGRDPVADAASLRLCQIQRAERQPVHSGHDASEGAEAETREEFPEPDWEVLSRQVLPVSTAKDSPYQVFHRVFCDGQLIATYLDEPSYQPGGRRTQQWLMFDKDEPFRDPLPLHLAGKRPVNNIDRYIEQNNHLSFVMVKDYICSHDDNGTREVRFTSSQIRLLSDAICKELQDKGRRLWKHLEKANKGMELSSPYPWFYFERARAREEMDNPNWPSNLKLLCECIEDCMKTTYEEFEKNAQQEKFPDRWDLLPLLFRPDEVVVKDSDGKRDYQCYIMHSPARVITRPDEDGEVLEIPVLTDPSPNRYLTYLYVSLSQFREFLKKYRSRVITGLPIYPFRYLPNGNQHDLLVRGWKVWLLGMGVSCLVENIGDSDQDFNQYVVDTYYEYKSAFREPPWDDAVEDPFEKSEWEVSRSTLSEDDENYLHEADSQGELEYELEAFDPISERSRRYLLCQPYEVNGFHLRDHVWKKLLVKDLMLPQRRPYLREDASKVIGRTSGLKVLLDTMLQGGRITIAARGRNLHEELEAISRYTLKPFYRIRISMESELASAQRTFQKAKKLAFDLNCIVLIEDLLGAYVPLEGGGGAINSAVTWVLRFLDEFQGSVIFIIPHDLVDLDYRIKTRICATFRLGSRLDKASVETGKNQESRKAMWKKHLGVPPDVQNLSERTRNGIRYYLDKLSECELPPATVWSLARFITSTKPINWDLLLDMARQKVRDLAPNSGEGEYADDSGEITKTKLPEVTLNPPPKDPSRNDRLKTLEREWGSYLKTYEDERLAPMRARLANMDQTSRKAYENLSRTNAGGPVGTWGVTA